MTPTGGESGYSGYAAGPSAAAGEMAPAGGMALGAPEGTSPACRARAILNRIGDKWAIYVGANLGSGPLRFSELNRSIDGIASRMLTVTLRGLERDGIVTRTMHAVIPPRVDYELTPLGKTLLDTIGQLVDWADTHVNEVEAAQAAYDARACPPPCSDDDPGR